MDSLSADVFNQRRGAFLAGMLLPATAQVWDEVPVTWIMQKVNVGDLKVPFGLT